jgi:hypothetical protein
MEAMTKHRSHSAAFKRQVAEELIAGETLHALSKRMDLSRSTFYDPPSAPIDADALLARLCATCDTFECDGYHRAGAALHHQSIVVKGKKPR